jgi:hypothetical protein
MQNKIIYLLGLAMTGLLLSGCESSSERFYGAIWQGDVDRVRRCLAEGAKADDGLRSAVHSRQLAVARLLLDSGADPNLGESTYGIETPVMLVSSKSNTQIPIDAPFNSDMSGNTQGRLTFIPSIFFDPNRREELEAGQPWFYRYRLKKESNLRPPLHYAVDNNDVAMVRLLLDRGAIPAAEYLASGAISGGNTAIFSCEFVWKQVEMNESFYVPSDSGSLHVVKKADGTIESTKCPFLAKRTTALKYAEEKKYIEILSILQSRATARP